MEHLQKLKIVAESINSKLSAQERKRVMTDLSSVNPSTKLLYITPEQAATDNFKVFVPYFLLISNNLIFSNY